MNKRRLVGIAFVLSVSLNLLFVGAIIGRVMSGSHSRSMSPPLGWVMRNLDAETRKKIQPGLESQAKVVAPLREEMHAARREFAQLLNEQDLDEVALKKSLGRLRKASGEYQSLMHEHMVLVLKDIEPEQRGRVSRFLMRNPGGRQHRRRPPG
jgi:uncharacterized membrane protein